MGKMGYSTLVSGKNREQKKRLDWSSASGQAPVASAVAIRCSQVCLLLSCLSASLLPAHINQGSDGRKEVWAGRRRGLGAEMPKAPAPGGWEGPIHGAVCLFFFWTGPAPDCPSLALLPLTCSFGEQRLQLNAPCHPEAAWLKGVCRRRWEGGRAQNFALPPKGEEVQNVVIKKCQTLPALTLTRPSLPEFPWHAQTLSLTVSASVFFFKELLLPDGHKLPSWCLKDKGVWRKRARRGRRQRAGSGGREGRRVFTSCMNLRQTGRISLLKVALNIMTCFSWRVMRKISWTSRRMSAGEKKTTHTQKK